MATFIRPPRTRGWGHRTDYHSLLWQSDIKQVWAQTNRIRFKISNWQETGVQNSVIVWDEHQARQPALTAHHWMGWRRWVKISFFRDDNLKASVWLWAAVLWWFALVRLQTPNHANTGYITLHRTQFTITGLDNHFYKTQAGLGAGSALAFGKFWTKIMTGFFESVSMDNVGDMWGLIIVPLSVDIMLISPLKRKLTKKINNDEQNNNMYTTKYILIFYTCPPF